ncbi:Crp/Fnr family transcriptional regulator [Georhizobium profundi]|jgi:CRP-like cAMP-binding protein|uniref:Crp/Fnr family transcriptional regulator n=1 Tax=Georhizobium profundi TaxID=2341112 RepID=A0A3Q8XLU0_9HYPH|nr:Crp/Fnr family transcriptional regulator [Georhizobium profundi]AZN70627.1 Crp/Fnr family transcriptional regulator [Georhizobium profundi]GLQ36475.1 Crp/Fnr family transcriptional regulator [Rhizobium albus]
MPHCLKLNLSARDRLTDAECAIIDQMGARQKLVPAKHDIVREGDIPTESCLVLSGFSARYHLLANGKRQISAIHVSGDFVDLHSLLLNEMDHGVVALSDCQVALVPHRMLRELTETEPHLSRLLWLSTLIDAAVHRRWLVTSGRLSASAQLAHLLCEIFLRLQVVELVDGNRFSFPISQVELSDALGLSTVHMNRTIRDLREHELVSWKGSEVTILNWDRLAEHGDFDAAYLNIGQQAR